uniref:Uncharacterized protein n=1 Tax=Anguilla anguilla TaxID=7936 RepID=A0A0E9UQ10_ANGAN
MLEQHVKEDYVDITYCTKALTCFRHNTDIDLWVIPNESITSKTFGFNEL